LQDKLDGKVFKLPELYPFNLKNWIGVFESYR
jgi:hypothetical protein